MSPMKVPIQMNKQPDLAHKMLESDQKVFFDLFLEESDGT